MSGGGGDVQTFLWHNLCHKKVWTSSIIVVAHSPTLFEDKTFFFYRSILTTVTTVLVLVTTVLVPIDKSSPRLEEPPPPTLPRPKCSSYYTTNPPQYPLQAKGKSSSRGKSSKDRFGSGFGSSSAGASTTTVLSSRDQRKLSRAKEELRIKKLQLALLDRRYTWTKTIKDAESVALLKSKALNARMDEYESVTVTDSALFKYWKDLQAHKKLVLQITRENQGSGIAVDDFG